MPHKATVLRVFVASPSDVHKERKVIPNILHEWNEKNFASKGIVLLPLTWENSSYPQFERRKRPQDYINRLICMSDLAVALFWTRVGTPTDKYDSGSIEEIERHLDAQKLIMLYFSNAKASLDDLDPVQHEKIKALKKKYQHNALTWSYSSVPDFRRLFRDHLDRAIDDKFKYLFCSQSTEDQLRTSSANNPATTPMKVYGSFSAAELRNRFPTDSAKQLETPANKPGFTMLLKLNESVGEFIERSDGRGEIYRHLLIENLPGVSASDRVKIRVIRFERLNSDKNWVRVQKFEGLYLQVPAGFAVANGTTRFDLGFITENEPGFWVQIDNPPPNTSTTVQKNEEVRVTLEAISANGKSNPLSIVIKWDGEWSSDCVKMAGHLRIRSVEQI